MLPQIAPTFRRGFKQILLSLIVLAAVLFSTFGTALPEVAACGGFFCTTKPVDQTAERIIFAVNKDEGTITAVVGIAYTGDSDAFSWVIPVPNPPTLDVAETKSLNVVNTATNLQFNVPADPCIRMMNADSANAVGAIPGAAGGGYLKTGTVGPYDYAIIKNTKTDEMISWLRTNGYQITKAMEPLVIEYVKEGLYFLAMRLKPGANSSEIKPVVMTYKATHPMIPIRLTAVAAVDNMQILVWILGQNQYVPDNYAHPSVDFSQMRAGFQPIQENGSTYMVLNSYRTAQKDFQAQYKGLAFLTEYAQPTAQLIKNLASADSENLDKVVAGLLQQYPYITRLRAQMSPNQMTLDPTFWPDAGAMDVSNVIDITKYVDANTFYGCPKQ